MLNIYFNNIYYNSYLLHILVIYKMKHFITYSHTEILETRISTDLDHNAETFTGKQCELLPAIIENRKQSGIFGTLRKTEL